MRKLFYRIFLLLFLNTVLAAGALAKMVPVNVMILGDSLSAAYNIPLERGWVNLLRQRVAEIYPDAEVINASVGGETAANAVNRLPLLIEEHQPDVIVIELGGNDGLRGYDLEKIKASLQSLIEISQNAGAEVVVTGIHLNPNYGPKFNRIFVDMYRELAETYGTHWVPFILQGIGDDAEKMQADAIHPKAEAQPYVLDNMWPHIEAAIKDAVKRQQK